MIKENLIKVLHEMEEVTKLFKLEPFDIYIIGGSACILGEYTNRATLDIDFVDLGYPAKYGKAFAKFKAFLWTLTSRNIIAEEYNIETDDQLEEQAKLINSFLKLAYWY